MTDLIKRLRDPNRDWPEFGYDRHEAADRIEELVKERDGYAHKLIASNNTYTEMHLEIERLSDQLAKAVEALRECQEALRDHMKQYPHMAKGYTVDAEKNARAALAELEGK